MVDVVVVNVVGAAAAVVIGSSARLLAVGVAIVQGQRMTPGIKE